MFPSLAAHPCLTLKNGKARLFGDVDIDFWQDIIASWITTVTPTCSRTDDCGHACINPHLHPIRHRNTPSPSSSRRTTIVATHRHMPTYLSFALEIDQLLTLKSIETETECSRSIKRHAPTGEDILTSGINPTTLICLEVGKDFTTTALCPALGALLKTNVIGCCRQASERLTFGVQKWSSVARGYVIKSFQWKNSICIWPETTSGITTANNLLLTVQIDAR